MHSIDPKNSQAGFSTALTAPEPKPKIVQENYMTSFDKTTELQHLIGTCIKVVDCVRIVIAFFEDKEIEALQTQFPYQKTFGFVNPLNSYSIMGLYKNNSQCLFGILTQSSSKMALFYAGEAEMSTPLPREGAVKQLLLGADSTAEISLEQLENAFSNPEDKLFTFSSTSKLSDILEGSLTVLGGCDFTVKSRTPFQVFEIKITSTGLTQGALLMENIPESKDTRPVWLGAGNAPHGTRKLGQPYKLDKV